MVTLTCISCDHPLYPHTACITSDGYRHLSCPIAEDNCNECHQPMISEWHWRKLDETGRHKALSEGKRRKSGPGQCSRCANAAYNARRRQQREQEREQAKVDRLEDLCWMAEHGESLNGAARRLGIVTSAVEHFLVRVQRRDVLDTLTRRNPVDHNRRNGGAAVVRAKRSRDPVAA